MNLENRISEILADNGVDFSIKNRSFVLNCPRCGKKDKVYIDRKAGFYICYVCSDIDEPGGKGTNPEYILAFLTGKKLDDIKEELYGISRKELYNDFDVLFDEKENTTYDLDEKVSIPEYYKSIDDPECEPGRKYLMGRGIPIAIAKEYGVMYSEFVRRVLFPAYVGEQLVGYQARKIDPVAEGEPKALSSRGKWRNKFVMFYNRLLGQEHAIITEGPVDAIKCHLIGGNIASLGKHITLKQLECIRACGITKLYIALDEDAIEGIPKIAREANMETFIVRTPLGREDFGDSTPQEVLEAFNKAEPVSGDSFFVNFDED